MSDAATLNPATRLKPRVVSGKDYATLVAACKAGGYALPAVNVVGSDSTDSRRAAAGSASMSISTWATSGSSAHTWLTTRRTP